MGHIVGMGSTIVCGVDTDDDRSRRALEVAADLAERLRRPLVVAYVVLSAPVARGGGPLLGVPAAGLPYPYPIEPGEGELDDFLDDARRRLEQLLAQWDAATAEVAVELHATAAGGLRRIAADRDAELLVVGSRGRGTIRAAVLGSTSHALAAEAPCPLVIVSVSD